MLFDTVNGPSCSIEQNLLQFQCSTGQKLNISQIPNLQSWIQLTYIADSKSNTSLLRLDQPSISLRSQGQYATLNTTNVFLGIGSQLKNNTGLIGDIREFYMNSGKLSEDSIVALASNVKVFEWSCLAYYQFDPNIGILKDSFRFQEGSIVFSNAQNYKLPVLYIDEGSKLTCENLNNFLNLPLFNNNFQSQSIKIPNFKFQQTQYQYTLNMWIRSSGTHTYSAIEKEGYTNQHFLLLDGVFALWFDGPASFRVFIFAQKDYQQESTTSINIPIHQWTNIQLYLDQRLGFLVNVYAQNGKLINSQQLASTSLGSQVPSGNVQILKNFIGEVKLIQLWQTTLQLPINSNQTNTSIINLDFRFTNYDGKQWTTSNGFTLPSSYGFDFYFTKVPADYIDYQNTSKIGMFNSTETLWDGSGCQTKIKNLVYVNGPLTSNFLIPATNQMTVEFWFRFKSPASNSQTIILHSLQTANAQSLVIYIQNGTLKCAPFGINSSEVLVYKNINVTSETRWQHVSCGFKQQLNVIGQYLAYEMKKQSTDIVPITFGLSLLGSSKRTPNYLIDLTFQSQLGSSQNALYFKELRVWSEMLTSVDLYTNRFNQVNSMSSSSLELNYKLLNGNLTIINEAQQNSVPAKGITSLENSDQQLIICPSDRYFSAIQVTCLQYPFDNLPITYTADLTKQNGLQVTFSNKYTRSGVHLPQVQPQVTQTWSFSNPQIYETSVSQQSTNVDLIMNPFTLGDGYQYTLGQFQLSTVDQFWQNTTQIIYPRKCYYVVDQVSGKSFTQVTTFRQQNNSLTPNFCMSFQIKQVDGCYGNFYNVFMQQVTIESSPMIPGLQNFTVINMGNNNGSPINISACLDGKMIANIRGNEPINLVFGVYWTTNQVASTAQSYINTVYQLIVIDQISVNLTATKQLVDFNQSTVLDASGSMFKNTNSKNGLYFRWKCPNEFQTLCDQFIGSPTMEVTPDSFKQYGGLSLTNYTFTVEVWSLQSGNEPLNPAQIFRGSLNLIWATFAAPEFEIIVPILLGQSVPKIVSSQDVILTVNIKNYRASDPRLKYQWQIQPSAKFNNLLTNTSISGSVFTIYTGALQPITSYTLTLTIYNSLNPQEIGVSQLNFTTGNPPTKGVVSSIPSSGTMFQTNFVIQSSGWTSNVGGALRANVYGVTNLNTIQLIQLGPSLQTLDSAGKFQLPPYTMPLIQGIKVDVFDLTGEKTTANLTLQVNRPTTQTDWPSVTQTVINSYKGFSMLQQKYLYFTFIGLQCNADFKASLIQGIDCLNAEALMLAQSMIDIYPISSNDSSQESQIIIESTVQMLQQITQNPQTLNQTIATWSLALMQSISGKVIPFGTATQDLSFQTSFLQTISNLIDYEASLVVPQTIGRRLQTDPQATINGLIVLKNILLDQLCNQSAQVQSSNLYITTRIFSVDDQVKDVQILNRLDTTLLSIPVDELLRTSKDYDPLTTSVCLQVTFSTQSPIPKYQYKNQQVLKAAFVQVGSLDNLGNRVLLDKGLQNLQSRPFKILQSMNTNDKQFKNNATMCMAYDATSQSSWTYNKCTTNYTNQGIVCLCNQLNNFYYGLVNDLTRTEIIEKKYAIQFNWLFILVLIPLIIFLLMTCIGPCLDAKDENDIQSSSKFTVTEEFVDKLAKKRNYQHKEVIYYRLKDIQKCQKLTTFEFVAAYGMISLNFHTLQSLIYKFDYKYSRSLRVSVIMLHSAAVTLFTIAAYSPMNFARAELPQNKFTPYVVVFIIGMTWIQIENLFLWIIRVDLVQGQQDDKTPYSPVLMKPKCYLLRILFQFIALSIYVLAIAIIASFMMGIQSVENTSYSFRLSQETSIEFVITWFVANIFGLIILQILRVLLISCFAYSKAKKIKSQEADDANQIQSKKQQEQASCIYWFLPLESVELCLDAFYTIDIMKEERDMLKNGVKSLITTIHPSDQSQDIMFDTNHLDNTKIQGVSQIFTDRTKGTSRSQGGQHQSYIDDERIEEIGNEIKDEDDGFEINDLQSEGNQYSNRDHYALSVNFKQVVESHDPGEQFQDDTQASKVSIVKEKKKKEKKRKSKRDVGDY